jgi:cation transport regulator ChaC
MSGLWVFGYGSLVSPDSFARTLGRELRPGIDFFEAELTGFGRRWNYGVMHSVGVWIDEAGDEHERTIVALGVVESAAESVNGVVGYVELDELTDLDRRERHYDRVDVADRTTVHTDGHADKHIDGSIMVYVPKRESIEHYERARDAGTAAVEAGYWSLVDAAFAALGPEQRTRYHATTPRPDVPIVPLIRR